MTQLTKQDGEEPVKNDMKIAIMTSILPAVIQDFVYQHVDSETKYVILIGQRVTSVFFNGFEFAACHFF